MTQVTAPRRVTVKEKVAALTDIWAFADLIEFQGGSKKFGDIHRELASIVTRPQEALNIDSVLDKERRRLIMMPRGHLKSTVAISLYILWRIYRNPDIRILVGTNIKRLARGLIRELRQYLEDQDLQKLVWNARPHIEGVLVPALDAAAKRKRNSSRSGAASEDENEALDKKVIWSSEAIQVIRPGKFKEPTVAAVSALTTVTGDHYDLLCLDDIVDFKNSDQPGKRENLEIWAGDLESVLNPIREVEYGVINGKTLTEVLGDEVVITGTRYFDGDLYSAKMNGLKDDALLKGEGVDAIDYTIVYKNVYKNGKDNTDGYLWHEYFNDRILESKKKHIKNKRQFAAQYLMQIITDEERIFKEEAIVWIHATQVETKDRVTRIRKGDEKPIDLRPFLFIDPAISQSSKADFTAIAVGAYDSLRRFYLLDLRVGRFLPNDTIEKMWELVDKWQISLVNVETGNGLGISLAYQIRQSFTRKKRALVVNEHRPGLEKKEARIQDNLEPLFANAGYFNATTWCGIREFKDEIEFYPRSAHDDVLDAIAWVAKLAVATSQKTGKPPGKTPINRTVNSIYGGTR
jgi:predicted phage terminase large subunit-like protein